MDRNDDRPAGASNDEVRPDPSALFDRDPVYPPLPEAPPVRTRALITPPRADVNLDVPHLHQLWDTPDDFNGHWACGPACCTMVLAYYGLLEPHPITVSQPEPHESPYGWYLSHEFRHGDRTFSATAPTPSGKAAGIYGTVVDRIGTGWGAHFHSDRGRGVAPLMKAFLLQVGNRVGIVWKPKGSDGFLERGVAEQEMTTTLDSGHPVIVSGRFTFHGKRYDHLIVVRGYYRDPSSGELQWIVNDPYGFETDTSFDGAEAVYSFDEIKPKWLSLFSGSFVPEASDHIPVRLFDKDSNEQVGEGTLIRGTDKVYIKRLDEAP